MNVTNTCPASAQAGDYVFTTEGHPVPIEAGRRRAAQQPPACAPGDPLEDAGDGGGACEAGAGSRVPAALRSLRLAKKLARMRALYGVPAGAGWSPRAPGRPLGGAPGGAPEAGARNVSGAGCAGARRGAAGRGPPRRRLVPPDWGYHASNTSALAARLCPHLAAPGGTRVLTACHTRDAANDGACARDADCGTDAWTCRRRRCSEHRFCVVPEQQ